jgi:hypothetical protein
LRRQEKRMMENICAILGGGTPQTTTFRVREPKVPQPRRFKGEGHNADRVLRQCENVFTIQTSSFLQDTIMIRYIGNLLEGTAAVNWFEADPNLIGQGAADRAAGQHDQLDSHWATWDIFTHSF